jgi:hypothetical protein
MCEERRCKGRAASIMEMSSAPRAAAKDNIRERERERWDKRNKEKIFSTLIFSSFFLKEYWY